MKYQESHGNKVPYPEAESKAFIDASCQKCHAKIGWFGTMLDHPGCSRCGWNPDPKTLKEEHEKMVNFRNLLEGLRRANPNWDKWREGRVAAGLTLRQAAKLLEVAPVTLSAIERGENRPSEALTKRMIRCYQGF